MRPTTEIKDVVLAQCSERLDRNAVDAVAEVSMQSTENAIRNSSPLANWDTYNAGL